MRVRSFLLSALLTATTAVGVGVAQPAVADAPSRTGASSSASASGSASAVHDDAHDTVYEVARRADGGFTVTISDPAPGVTNAELRATLSAQGRPVLAKGDTVEAAIARQTGKPQLTALACLSYYTAHQWCGRAWAANGYEDPQVYFLDHTSSAWPVTASTTKWNEAQGIDSYYRWYTQGCPGSGRHCVNVYNGSYGSTGWTGQTSWGTDSTGDYDNTTNVTIKLNDSYGGTAAQHRNTTCHEMGHALGLDHNDSTGSCLYSSRTSTLYPNSHDFGLLPRIYGY